MSVFQRRLASSTWAILRSLERRAEKLHAIIEDVDGSITEDELRRRQGRLNARTTTPWTRARLTKNRQATVRKKATKSKTK